MLYFFAPVSHHTHLGLKKNRFKENKNYIDALDTGCETPPSSGETEACSIYLFFMCHIPSPAILAQIAHACLPGEDLCCKKELRSECPTIERAKWSQVYFTNEKAKIKSYLNNPRTSLHLHCRR